MNGAASDIKFKFDVDTSIARGIYWSDSSGETTIARILYHNINQNVIINPIGSESVWNDAVGKYSLFIGNNKLTYNTYNIWHAGNFTPSNYLPLTGGTMTGHIYIKN